jgi:hypothetical protein
MLDGGLTNQVSFFSENPTISCVKRTVTSTVTTTYDHVFLFCGPPGQSLRQLQLPVLWLHVLFVLHRRWNLLVLHLLLHASWPSSSSMHIRPSGAYPSRILSSSATSSRLSVTLASSVIPSPPGRFSVLSQTTNCQFLNQLSDYRAQLIGPELHFDFDL